MAVFIARMILLVATVPLCAGIDLSRFLAQSFDEVNESSNSTEITVTTTPIPETSTMGSSISVENGTTTLPVTTTEFVNTTVPPSMLTQTKVYTAVVSSFTDYDVDAAALEEALMNSMNQTGVRVIVRIVFKIEVRMSFPPGTALSEAIAITAFANLLGVAESGISVMFSVAGSGRLVAGGSDVTGVVATDDKDAASTVENEASDATAMAAGFHSQYVGAAAAAGEPVIDFPACTASSPVLKVDTEVTTQQPPDVSPDNAVLLPDASEMKAAIHTVDPNSANVMMGDMTVTVMVAPQIVGSPTEVSVTTSAVSTVPSSRNTVTVLIATVSSTTTAFSTTAAAATAGSTIPVSSTEAMITSAPTISGVSPINTTVSDVDEESGTHSKRQWVFCSSFVLTGVMLRII